MLVQPANKPIQAALPHLHQARSEGHHQLQLGGQCHVPRMLCCLLTESHYPTLAWLFSRLVLARIVPESREQWVWGFTRPPRLSKAWASATAVLADAADSVVLKDAGNSFSFCRTSHQTCGPAVHDAQWTQDVVSFDALLGAAGNSRVPGRKKSCIARNLDLLTPHRCLLLDATV